MTKEQQEHWRKAAHDWLSHIALNPNADGKVHKPVYTALRDALATIEERDKEIEQLRRAGDRTDHLL